MATYTVDITYNTANAKLATLEFTNITLNPVFDPETFVYVGTANAQTFTFTATAQSDQGVITATLNSTAISQGETVTLEEGNNSITIVCLAADIKETYTIGVQNAG